MPITRPTVDVDRRIPRTTLVAGYCFNTEVLHSWARHVIGDHYGEDLNDVADAMFDMSEFIKDQYDLVLHPLGEELTAEAFDFLRGYLGYPQERLPEIDEGPWEARLREALIREGLSPDDFYFAQRYAEL
ncbi:hypothetical protein CPB85DRAFT_1325843 [Mucidula mucida]|nr:hypothetical protein CPB85DRAFT_1325843 [Mucidula mucida]